jgi:hypothetical protein
MEPMVAVLAGDGLWEMCANLGPVINLRVLWQNLIFTTDPNHIKVIPTSFVPPSCHH